MEELPPTTSLTLALGAALVLAALHLAAPRIRRQRLLPERAVASLAGGIAVAYVFLHLLPDLADGNDSIGEALADTVRVTALLDLAIFLVALAGFTAFYGLERAARRGGVEGEAPPGIFYLHLGSFLVYNALITYTMPLRVETGVAYAVLFTIAMGLHFVLTDRGLAVNYPLRFARSGRYALAAALLVGWTAAALLAPSIVLVSLLTALLGGSVLLNVFKEELPSDRQSSFVWFVAGLVLYSGLLAATTALAG